MGRGGQLDQSTSSETASAYTNGDMVLKTLAVAPDLTLEGEEPPLVCAPRTSLTHTSSHCATVRESHSRNARSFPAQVPVP